MITTTYVKVVGPGPDAKFHGEPPDEDTDVVTFFNRRYIGRVGKVVAALTGDDLWSIGGTPKDPAYRVRFGPGWGVPTHEEIFWTEELAPVRRVRR